MKIPDCYEAFAQEEQRQAAWDEYLEKLPTCCICGHKIMDGEDVHEARGKSVCASCMEELAENVGCVEVE
jgi:hypothetical protein